MSLLRQRRKFDVWLGRTWATIKPASLQIYVLKQFLTVLIVCLLASVSLFLVFDLFDRISLFIKEGVSIVQVLSYLMYKIPLIVQLMLPVAVLVATLLSIGRMSQLSEITAMRACGISLFFLARPLIITGLLLSLGSFIAGETIIPSATQKVDEIYHLDIKKKAEKGKFSRSNFWYRKGNRFYNIGLYDSRTSMLKGISVFELNNKFRLVHKTDAKEAIWGGSSQIGWTMSEVIEIALTGKGEVQSSAFQKAPLVIDEEPSDFYNMERSAEALSYHELQKYIEKLKAEGVPATNYLVDLAAKLSFPLVNVIVILIAFPFALISARSGNLTMSFVAGVSVGFGYYVVHALSVSLGNAELIPIQPAAWTANIILGSLGGYFMAGMEHRI